MAVMLQIVLEPVDPLVLDSIFPTLGRNDRCHCSSGQKYKRCHESIDRVAWRLTMLKTRQAEAVRARLLPWRLPS
jgi:SEC-C motif